MKEKDYLEEVAKLPGLEGGLKGAIGYLVLRLERAGSYIPRFRLPHHVIGWETDCECLRVFSRNPGLRRIYRLYADGGSRFIVVEGRRRVGAVTPRSMFLHLMKRAAYTSVVVSYLLRRREGCVPYMSTVKRVVEAMDERLTGAVPVCYRGKTRYIATAAGVAEYLAKGGRLSARIYSLKEFLDKPHIYTSVSELISGIRNHSYGIYAPDEGEEVFVSEHSLYEASRKLLQESIR